MSEGKTIKVAIQGIPGANHEIAARAYFKDQKVEVVPCYTFRDLFKAMHADPELRGIMAIENTLVGSLLPNYTLLRESGFTIQGEHKLRIKHHLMTLPGQSIKDIKEVHSHPMALAQCEEFFQKHPHIKLIESEDTALSAKQIADRRVKGIGAIAPSLAAKLYNLEIIERGIETNKHNYTRFLILGRENKAEKEALLAQNRINKSSLVFSLPHEEGSLSKVLTILAFYNINLTKIQSLPVVGIEWEYLFYIDIMFNDYERYLQSLDAIRPLCKKLRILGEYEACTTTHSTNGDSTESKEVHKALTSI
ncbi:prephenate dehydratase [Thermophagus xiamenensis]|uniref:prephenate dehydratase n=1 Tax=Thermophagus xiamenensis TaxID=385682 RepID=A0A1I2FJX7_9BACT|nr:prephenate dehydratase [Thermophagus xiamenensis]SFF04761.1 prephenate dehydratase [Thermophagus xiamenensis]